MRIATWNVNGLRARLPFVLHWLEARRPDVVGLQETKIPDELFPHLELEAAGYRVACHGEKGWNGVAVLARGDTPEILSRGLPGRDDHGARLLTTRVAGLEFTTAYVPNGKHVGHPDFLRKLAWLDALTELVGRVDAGAPAVLCGDFNLCPGPIDSWNEAALAGTIFHTDEERRRFRRLLDLGWHDLFRDLNPGLQAFSWWDYRGGAFHRKQGLRIDLMLATPPIGRRARAAEIDRDYRKKKDGLTASDHAPVLVDLEEEEEEEEGDPSAPNRRGSPTAG